MVLNDPHSESVSLVGQRKERFTIIRVSFLMTS